MPEFRLPLSGDVTQLINPMTWFLNSTGNQYGLININLGKSSDPRLEQQIIEDVGTYGKQIGQIGDALRVLLDHFERGKKNGAIKEDEQRAIRAFRFQLDEVDRLKKVRQRD